MREQKTRKKAAAREHQLYCEWLNKRTAAQRSSRLWDGRNVGHKPKPTALKKQKKRKGKKRGNKRGGSGDPFSPYKERDRYLVTLGFKSYRDYLDSNLWKSIRLRVMQRDGNKCQCCQGPAVQVHNKRYGLGQLNGMTLDEMVAICIDCHQAIEFTGERKNSLKETNERLAMLSLK